MMGGITKLRDFAVANLCGKPGLALLDIADEIEREIEANYMELPKDADGVPIRVGDKLRGVYETFEVCAVSEHYAYWEQGRHWDSASECRHAKPDPLFDTLALLEDGEISIDEATKRIRETLEVRDD